MRENGFTVDPSSLFKVDITTLMTVDCSHGSMLAAKMPYNFCASLFAYSKG